MNSIWHRSCVAQLSRARNLVVLAVALAGLHCVGGGGAQGQDLPFSSGSTGADGPGPFPSIGTPFRPGRNSHAMAFDGARNQMVLFGGAVEYVGGGLSDTWLFDGRDWVQASPLHVPPPASPISLVYDSARHEVVFFGGEQTWTWDGSDWSEKNPLHKPPNDFYTAVYDVARSQMVLLQLPTSDTWTWDGIDWTKRSPAHRPRTRGGTEFNTLTYDDARHLVVFAGGGGLPVIGETWVWDGTDWLEVTPVIGPSYVRQHAVAYDAVRQRVVLFDGVDRTWIWDGTVWTLVHPLNHPNVDRLFAMAYDASHQQVLLTGGTALGVHNNSTWAWDGGNWTQLGGDTFNETRVVDLSAKTDGVWNYSRVIIPPGLTVKFIGSPGGIPVQWLVTGEVQIDGLIDLSGAPGLGGSLVAALPAGGPGGFGGGQAGIPSFDGSSFAGGPGQGPGGGTPGVASAEAGQPGRYASRYGNAFVQPLIGGSGGGGSASTVGAWGNFGGGGGGAIMISSSRDITVNGRILANGGAGFGGSGAGSGGAIRLRADRITLGPTGSLEATNDGRIRLESFERAILGAIHPADTQSTTLTGPMPDLPGAEASLLVERVAGQVVAQPPGGDLVSPDVMFTAAGDITVTVRARNVPDGTPVTLRLAMIGQVITKPSSGEPNVVLAAGKADFILMVPKGRGTLQAFAEFSTP